MSTEETPSSGNETGYKHADEFLEMYNYEKVLGEGMFSMVKLARHKETGDSYAVKVITKDEMEEFDKQCLRSEIDVLTNLLPHHKHIIRLYNVYEDDKFYHLVTELVVGGELFNRLVNKEKYTELETRDVCTILFHAVQHMHSHQIAHRDLKPENLLLQHENSDTDIKIADFGFAKKCTSPTGLKTQCGSPGHVAPEILENVPYGLGVDIWSLGVIAFTLIGGYPPFLEEDRRELFRKIRNGEFAFEEKWWGHVSHDAKDMIKSCLTVDVSERATINQLLEKSWFQDDSAILSRTSLIINQERLKAYNARRHFKSAVLSIMAVQKMNSLFEEIKEE